MQPCFSFSLWVIEFGKPSVGCLDDEIESERAEMIQNYPKMIVEKIHINPFMGVAHLFSIH